MIRFLLFLYFMTLLYNGATIGYDIGKHTVKKDDGEHTFISSKNIGTAALIVLVAVAVACMIRL